MTEQMKVHDVRREKTYLWVKCLCDQIKFIAKPFIFCMLFI